MVSQSIKDYCSLNCSVNICGLVISYADSSLFLLASWRSQHMRLSHFHAKASRLASIFYAKSTSSNARIFLRLQSPLHTQSISHATSILRMHIDSLLNAIKDIYIYIYIYISNQAPRELAGCNRGKAIYIPKSWCWRGNPRSNLNPTWYIPLAKQYNPRRTPLVYACLCQRHGHIFNQACGGGVLTPYELWRHSARMTPLTGHHL